MSWKTLQTRAAQMGFEVAFRTRWQAGNGGYMPDLSPPAGRHWTFIGCYDDVAALWVKPLSARQQLLDAQLVQKMMLELDSFIGTSDDLNDQVARDAFNTVPATQAFLNTLSRGERRRSPSRERRCASLPVSVERRTSISADRRGSHAAAWLRLDSTPITMQ